MARTKLVPGELAKRAKEKEDRYKALVAARGPKATIDSYFDNSSGDCTALLHFGFQITKRAVISCANGQGLRDPATGESFCEWDYEHDDPFLLFFYVLTQFSKRIGFEIEPQRVIGPEGPVYIAALYSNKGSNSGAHDASKVDHAIRKMRRAFHIGSDVEPLWWWDWRRCGPSYVSEVEEYNPVYEPEE